MLLAHALSQILHHITLTVFSSNKEWSTSLNHRNTFFSFTSKPASATLIPSTKTYLIISVPFKADKIKGGHTIPPLSKAAKSTLFQFTRHKQSAEYQRCGTPARKSLKAPEPGGKEKSRTEMKDIASPLSREGKKGIVRVVVVPSTSGVTSTEITDVIAPAALRYSSGHLYLSLSRARCAI